MDVVADVGDAIEMDKVAVAIVDERDNLCTARTGEVAEEHIGALMAGEPCFNLGDIAQELDFGREMGGCLIVEIADETVTCIETLRHALMEIGEIVACTHEDDGTGIATTATDMLENRTTDVAAKEKQKENKDGDEQCTPEMKIAGIIDPKIQAETEAHENGCTEDTLCY